jgi:ubiquinone/menaquinone biosynthesis C-methylase UbiE
MLESMSFPYHDKNWTDIADFLDAHYLGSERILANDIFWWRFNRIYRYANLVHNPAAEYDWVVLHKGELQYFPIDFLESVNGLYSAVFANEVFILWTNRADIESLENNPDIECYSGLVDKRREVNFQPQAVDDFVSPNHGVIEHFQHMSKSDVSKAMDEFFLAGGYEYTTLRDKTFYEEIDRWLKNMCADFDGFSLLDVACGEARVASVINNFDSLLEIDISSVATKIAHVEGVQDTRRNAVVMDAESLAIDSESFDVVTFIEAAEHVHDFCLAVSEMARVLKPNGSLIMNGANTDSLHHRLSRSLGYPYFKTNYQHICEYSFKETTDILKQHGFEIEQAEGIFLYPYWGVPGVDEHVREVTDDDPELVEALRLLGEKGGPDLAYCYILKARKVN